MEVIPLPASQVKQGAKVLANAFLDDPFFTITLTDIDRRASILPWIFEKEILYGQRFGKVYTTTSMDGVAMWLGPSNPNFSLIGILWTGMFLLPLKLKWAETKKTISPANFANQSHKKAISGRHLYLYGIGVEPERQGQGVGNLLLQYVLGQADREALVCYLETNNEMNILFYEHNGFKLSSQGRARLSDPYLWAMVRQPA